MPSPPRHSSNICITILTIDAIESKLSIYQQNLIFRVGYKSKIFEHKFSVLFWKKYASRREDKIEIKNRNNKTSSEKDLKKQPSS